METTEENSTKRYGIIYFPTKDISDSQVNSLKVLEQKIKNFDDILVSVSPYMDNGVIDVRAMFKLSSIKDFDLETKIRNIYKQINNSPSRKR